MSGVWNTATLDITLPSNVAPATGSGALYLGGPQLPAELKNAGYTSAIVWFSNGNAYLKYWFMARYGDLSVDSWTFGYCTVAPGPTLGTLVNMDAINAFSFPTNDVQRDITKIQVLVGSGAFVRLSKGGPPIIKADYALTGMDGWGTDTSTQTVTGVAGCTLKYWWRWTPDYICEVRYLLTCPATTSGSNLVLPLPTPMPRVDLGPSSIRGAYGSGLASRAGQQESFTCRMDPTSMTLFGNSSPFTYSTYEGSFVYTVAKP